MNKRCAVAIIAPFPPPYGGMTVQAKRLYERLKESGIMSFFIHTNISFPRFLSVFDKVTGVRTLVRFILFSLNLVKLKRATVVHIFGASHLYFFLVVSPSIFAAKIMKKKVILNYRGGEAERFLQKWGFVAIPVIKKADVIAVPSSFLKEIFERATGKEIIILPNLVDIETFRYRERTNLKPFIVVSRQLEPRYNMACALRAFKIVKKNYAEARLMIAGTGSEEKRLKELQKEMSLTDVYFLGALTHGELSRIYDDCDIMINPSNTDNFPGSILEAFACGLPVVTTRVGGIPFMVKEGETGILVDPDDHENLAKGVLTLLREPALAKAFSVNGKKFAEEYSWERIKHKIFNIYGLILEEKQTHGKDMTF